MKRSPVESHSAQRASAQRASAQRASAQRAWASRAPANGASSGLPPIVKALLAGSRDLSRLARCLLALPLLLLLPGARVPANYAGAPHPESFSRSQVRVGPGGIELTLRVQVQSLAEVVPELAEGITGKADPQLLAEAAPAVRAYLGRHYRLLLEEGEEGQLVELPGEPWSRAGVLLVEGELDLPGGDLVDISTAWESLPADMDALVLQVELFLETSPRHRDLCQLFWFDEEPAAQVFHGLHREWRWPPRRPDLLSSWAAFAGLGLMELSRGWSSVLVVLLLVLGGKGRAGVGLRLAVFLAGEALGLAAAEAEALQAPVVERLVELAHVLSVAYLAADRLLHGPGRRWVEPALIGVVHGLALHGAVAGPLAGLYHQLIPVLGTWMGQGAPLLLLGLLLGRLGLGARTDGEESGLDRMAAWLCLLGGLAMFGGEILPGYMA